MNNKFLYGFFVFSITLFGCTSNNISSSKEKEVLELNVGYVETMFDPSSYDSSVLIQSYEVEYDQRLIINFLPFSDSISMLETLDNPYHEIDMVIAEDFLLANLFHQSKLVSFDREPLSGGGNFTYIENVSNYESYFFKRYWDRTFFSNKKLLDWIVPFDFSTYGVLYEPALEPRVSEGKTTLEQLLLNENRHLLHVDGTIKDAFLHYKWSNNANELIQIDDNLNHSLYRSRFWQEQYGLRHDGGDKDFQEYLKSFNDTFDLSMLNEQNARLIKTSDYLRFVKPELIHHPVELVYERSPEVNIFSFQGIGLLNSGKKEPLQLLINSLMDPEYLLQHSQIHKTGLFLSRAPLEQFFTSLEDPLAPSENPPLINLTHYLKRNIFDSTTYQFKWAVNSEWRLIYSTQSTLDEAIGLFNITKTFPNLVQISQLENLESEFQWIHPWTVLIILLITTVIIFVVVKIKYSKNKVIFLKPYKMKKLKEKYLKNPIKYKKTYRKYFKEK